MFLGHIGPDGLVSDLSGLVLQCSLRPFRVCVSGLNSKTILVRSGTYVRVDFGGSRELGGNSTRSFKRNNDFDQTHPKRWTSGHCAPPPGHSVTDGRGGEYWCGGRSVRQKYPRWCKSHTPKPRTLVSLRHGQEPGIPVQ